MLKARKLRRLLSSQEQLHALEMAALADAEAQLSEALAEQGRCLANASGDNPNIDPALVSALSDPGRVWLAAAALNQAVERQTERVTSTGHLERRLRSLHHARWRGEQREAEARELTELVELFGALRARKPDASMPD